MILYIGRKGSKSDLKKEIWGYRLLSNQGELIDQKVVRGRVPSEITKVSVHQRCVMCIEWAVTCLSKSLLSKDFCSKLTGNSLTILYTNTVVQKWIERDTPQQFRVLCADMMSKIEQLPFDIKLINSEFNPVLPVLVPENIERERYQSITEAFSDIMD